MTAIQETPGDTGKQCSTYSNKIESLGDSLSSKDIEACQTSLVNVPKGTFPIRDAFTCESRNIIYATSCKSFDNTYVSETSKELTECFREHLLDIHIGYAKLVCLFHLYGVSRSSLNDLPILLKPCLISSPGTVKPSSITIIVDS